MEETKIQVNKNHYDFLKYQYITRFASYYYQIKTILELNPSKVLEIGKGSGLFSDLIKKESNINITVCDFDPSLQPDVIGDVRNLPFENNSFDCVCSFQVLEHLPFEDFEMAISELKRVSSKYIFISLPDAGRYMKIDLRLPKLGVIKKVYSLSKFKKDVHKFDGEHYWEIDKVGYDEQKISNILADDTWKIVINYRLLENLYHRFYLLERN